MRRISEVQRNCVNFRISREINWSRECLRLSMNTNRFTCRSSAAIRLVRYRELELLLPEIEKRGVHTQIVTSAFRVIPGNWTAFKKLNVVVSIDGLQPEHDARRKPATYERILKNIQGARVTVHCTITSQIAGRPGYLDEFLEFWSGRPEIVKVWFSLFTPQRGATDPEILTPPQRAAVIADLRRLRVAYPVLEMPESLIREMESPPKSPRECIFARTTQTISADLRTHIHALPVRRRSGLRPVRLHRIDGVGRRWPSPRVGWAHRRTNIPRFRSRRQRIEDDAKKIRKANAVSVRTFLVQQGATHHKHWQDARLKHLTCLRVCVRGCLSGVRAFDVETLLLAVSILAAVTTIVGLIPAWRSSRVEPMKALRTE